MIKSSLLDRPVFRSPLLDARTRTCSPSRAVTSALTTRSDPDRPRHDSEFDRCVRACAHGSPYLCTRWLGPQKRKEDARPSQSKVVVPKASLATLSSSSKHGCGGGGASAGRSAGRALRRPSSGSSSSSSPSSCTGRRRWRTLPRAGSTAPTASSSRPR
jgi:hypothetical protein